MYFQLLDVLEMAISGGRGAMDRWRRQLALRASVAAKRLG